MIMLLDSNVDASTKIKDGSSLDYRNVRSIKSNEPHQNQKDQRLNASEPAESMTSENS